MARDQINTFALVDDDGQVTLVDTGIKRAPPAIVRGLEAMGKGLGDVTRILLTHAHSDHAGGAAELARRSGAPVAIHELDAEFLAKGTPPPRDRSSRLARLLDRLPGGGFPAVDAGDRLADGQVLPIAGGVRVIATPGHTPGHVSLLLQSTDVLITGDALFNWLFARGISFSPRPLCSDFRLTQRSAHELGELEYDTVAFIHGPEIREHAREQVRAFLASQPPPAA